MYKVMLVDDDYPVLEYLEEVIDWKGLGLELIGLHENGLQALDAVQAAMPDIVITDIGMPKMDGLQLLEQLKQMKPDIRAAILSCHSDFHYAKQALKLKVHDYVIKDTLQPAELTSLLQQFVQALDKEQQVRHYDNLMRYTVDRSMSILREKFIASTMQQPLLGAESWLQELKQLGLEWRHGEEVVIVCCRLDEREQLRKRFMTEEVLRFTLNNALEELLQQAEQSGKLEGRRMLPIIYETYQFLLIYRMPGSLKENGYDQLRSLLRFIQQQFSRDLRLGFSALLSGKCASPAQFKQELEELLQAETIWFYRQYGTLLLEKPSLQREQQQSMLFLASFKERIMDLYMRLNIDEIHPLMSEWSFHVQEQRLSPKLLKDWLLRISLEMRNHKLMFSVEHSSDSIHRRLYELETLQETVDWFLNHYIELVSQVNQSAQLSKRHEIVEAYQYVLRHLDRKITLEEVAEALYLNPSYFSRLFKKETGETFIEYVTKMKLTRAKQMLRETRDSVGKICELLGYDNQSYFIKLFKNETGVTPAEYRAMKRGVNV